jgi:superfamily II DNA or RNA helicase
MPREPRANTLTVVTPGIARVSSLFTQIVRQRAVAYLNNGSIRITASEPDLLSARVQGSETYSSVYRRDGEALRYGCSCPFFQDRREGCKHLWALALSARDNPLIDGAAGFAQLVADPELVSSREKRPEPAQEEEPEVEQQAEEAAIARRASLRAERWQDVIERIESQAGSGSVKYELFYFVRFTPQTAPGFSLLVGRKRLAARPGPLEPAQRMSQAALAHDADRPVHALVFDTIDPDYAFHRPWPRHRVTIPGGFAPLLLEKLAASGRCHVVPDELGPLSESWLLFRQAARIKRSQAETLPGFDEFLNFPRLVFGKDFESRFRLEVALREGSGKKGELTLGARLVRGEEERTLESLVYTNPSGLVVSENELVLVEAHDVPWLEALTAGGARPGALTLPRAEVEDFVRASQSGAARGLSNLVLPPDYARLPAKAPVPVLDLGDPGARTVSGRVSFEYEMEQGSERISADAKGKLVPVGDKRLLERELGAEKRELAVLRELGFEGPLLDVADEERLTAEVSIRDQKLLPAIRRLLELGWKVTALGKPYRRLSRTSLRLEAGIDWFELQGTVTFAEQDVALPELLRNLKQRRLEVELGDGSHGLLPEDWLASWGVLALVAPEKGNKLRFSNRQVGLLDTVLGTLPFDATEPVLAKLRERLSRFSVVEPEEPPRGFRGELRPYQKQGLGWLTALSELGFGACLADDMGLGKTVQVLAFLMKVHAGAGARPSLIVVPRSLVSNWVDEARRFAPGLDVHVHWGSDRRSPSEGFGDASLVVTTYGTLRLDAAAFAELDFECVVLDEAQAIKNASSATAKVAKSLKARQRLALTGTPVENHLGELWSLFDFLNPTLLDELPALKKVVSRSKPSPETWELIRRVVRPFVLRRSKREVASDLPDRIEQTLFVELDERERKDYDALRAHYRKLLAKKTKELGIEKTTPHVLEALLRLRQAACHPGLLDPARRGESSAKLDALLSNLHDLREEGHKALVFSQFTTLLGIVRERLEAEGIPFEYLDGQTRDRAERVERFQSDPNVTAFLISLKAGGVGLNLTAADYVFILDPWWNPAAEAQAIDRAHRIGQSRHVIACRLLSRDTVEERVAELQEKKRGLVSALMDEPTALSGRLSRSDLEALLELGKG